MGVLHFCVQSADMSIARNYLHSPNEEVIESNTNIAIAEITLNFPDILRALLLCWTIYNDDSLIYLTVIEGKKNNLHTEIYTTASPLHTHMNHIFLWNSII